MALQAGLRLSRCLATLNLDNNPLGPEGAAAMIVALARQHVGAVSMHHCDFFNASHAQGACQGPLQGPPQYLAAAPQQLEEARFFEVQRPNRKYRLQLGSPAQYALAAVLVRYWRYEGPQTWLAASFDGMVRSMS
jgi:hypothetical protein